MARVAKFGFRVKGDLPITTVKELWVWTTDFRFRLWGWLDRARVCDLECGCRMHGSGLIPWLSRTRLQDLRLAWRD